MMKKILILFIGIGLSYGIAVLTGACGDTPTGGTSTGSGTPIGTRWVNFDIPFGNCNPSENRIRINTTTCCIFDPLSANPVNVGSIPELISNYDGNCGFDKIVAFPGGPNCWHGSIVINSSGYSKTYDLSSAVTSNNSEIKLEDDCLRVKIPNESATVEISIFEPCLPFDCRKRPQDYPRAKWQRMMTVESSQNLVNALVSELTVSTSGLCN
jgi:hypothetical protein